jgi:putative ABC transport system permease protein
MSTTLLERPEAEVDGGRAEDGGVPARRAVVRWGWRLFKREWRQQVLVLALLTVAVMATTAGVAVVTNSTPPGQTTFVLSGSDQGLAADVAALQATFGATDVFAHQKVAVPGSVATVEVRAPVSSDASHHRSLRLFAGRLPTRADEVAMTRSVASLFDLHVGGLWRGTGRDLRVVGLVENPRELSERFALLAPGQIDHAESFSIEIAQFDIKHFAPVHLPSGTPVQIEGASPGARTTAAIAVLVMEVVGLLLVGLIAVAGFTVLAQRRMRALGMLESIGATDRHLRLVILANGAAVGVAAAIVGTAVGLAGWLAFAPRLENLAHHRIDRFNLPWWAVAAAMALAVITAVAASWWPARAASRTSVVAALSGRPPRPQPAHRFVGAGVVLLGVGEALLFLAHGRRPLVVATGAVATAVGVILFAPLAIRAVADAARQAPIAVRLALRDLARYQARSGAALGAVTLAVGIAATVAVSAAARNEVEGSVRSNLAANEMAVYSDPGALKDGPISDVGPAEQAAAHAHVDTIATALGTHDVLGLDKAVNPEEPIIQGPQASGRDAAGLVTSAPAGEGVRIELVHPLYVATPAVLAHYGIAPTSIDPTADVVTSYTGLSHLQLNYGMRQMVEHPKFQHVVLPTGRSEPNVLLTAHAMQALGLREVPVAWLLTTPRPLTSTQIDAARKAAAASGLTIETRTTGGSFKQLGDEATLAGLVLALGVLAMTVGLIRSETASDLRVLAATGASSSTRRSITAATTGALAALGAVLGVADAYLAMVAFHRSDLVTLSNVPLRDLVVILVALPVAATAAGWLLAGREPRAIARQPLE